MSFTFAEGDLAQMSASQLNEYQAKVHSVFEERKTAGTADLEFLGKVRDALSKIKSAKAALEAAAVEEISKSLESEGTDEADDEPDEGAEVSDEESGTESGQEDGASEGELSNSGGAPMAAEDDEPDEGEDDDDEEPEEEMSGDEDADASAGNFSVDDFLTKVSALIDSRLAAATISQADNPRKEENMDLSGLGQDAPGSESETPLANRVELVNGDYSKAQLEADLMRAIQNQSKGTTGEMIKVGTIYDAKNPEVSISEGKTSENYEAIMASGAKYLEMTQPEVLTAAMCCAPIDPIRELTTWCDARTGLFSLPRIGSNHGGVNYALPSNACGLTVTPFTWAEECAPGSGPQADKACQTIECGLFEEVRVNAFGWCFEGTNGDERFNLEQLGYFLAEARCRFEHLNAQRTLDLVLTHPRVSGEVAAPDTLAASGGSVESDLFSMLSIRFDNMRRDLTNPGLTPHVVAPAWIDDLLRVDHIRRTGTVTGGSTLSTIVSALGGTSETIQHWQPVSSTADAWPTDVEMLIHAPGVFREVDGGQLDFGIVRDSELNKQNLFRMMFERWNAVAFMGPDCSVNYVEITGLCPNGAVGPRIDVCAG